MSKQKMPFYKSPLFIVVIGLGLLAMSAFLYLGKSNQSSTGSNVLVEATAPATDAEVPRVSLGEARAALDSGEAVFVDTRNADSYAAGHIPGAVLVTSSQVDSMVGQMDPEKWVITYCT